MAGANRIAICARRIEVHPLRFALIATLATAAAVAASLALGGRVPFNEEYACCEADHAEWKLIVECSAGSSGEPEYEAYYRKRSSPLPEHCWALACDDTDVGCVEYFCVGCSWMVGECGFGEEVGFSTFESCTFDPTETTEGVDIAVEYERSENGKELEATKGVLSIPFRREVVRQLGSLRFHAKWERLK